jgi:hypothetical protein
VEPTKLLTPKEVELLYGLNPKTLRNERVLGKGLPFIKLNGRIFYRLQDIEKSIDQNIFYSTTEYQKARQEKA